MTSKVTDRGANDLLGGSKRVDDRSATWLSNRASIKAGRIERGNLICPFGMQLSEFHNLYIT